jgi:hypothetical protein
MSDQRRFVLSDAFDSFELARGWESLRSRMIRQQPEEFSRPEWAYLISFMAPSRIEAVIRHGFGPLEASYPREGPFCLLRPRGEVALWLPNNVSLLGPLTLILVSLTGNRITAKGGSRSEDLTRPFIEFALEHLEGGLLKDYLTEQVRYEVFEHSSPEMAAMAKRAEVRIFFGSDEAAAEIENLPHPISSSGVYFTDRTSEVWADADLLDDEALTTLIKVFAIYGQAGCTSPHRVVLLDGDVGRAQEVAERVCALFSSVITENPHSHTASQSFLGSQLAKAAGFSCSIAPNHAAVLAVGPPNLAAPRVSQLLPVTWSSLEERIESLPENIQTIGHVLGESGDRALHAVLSRSSIKRFVPLSRMHDFGPIWDGRAFFEELFERVEVDQ